MISIKQFFGIIIFEEYTDCPRWTMNGHVPLKTYDGRAVSSKHLLFRQLFSDPVL